MVMSTAYLQGIHLTGFSLRLGDRIGRFWVIACITHWQLVKAFRPASVPRASKLQCLCHPRQEGNTPLHLAAINGYADVIRGLVELRGNIRGWNEVSSPGQKRDREVPRKDDRHLFVLHRVSLIDSPLAKLKCIVKRAKANLK